MFDSLEDLMIAASSALKPPERLTVSEAAVKYRVLNTPGGFSGPWSHDKTPYMVEPMDTLTSTEFTGMAFVGPAQAAKTEIFNNFLLYTVLCDAMDMMFIHPTQKSAREFSFSKLNRFFRYNKDVGSLIMPGRQNKNTFDVRFTNGMILTLSWPTITELSGKSVPLLWLTDYDRMVADVEDEGPPFDLARKRATSFKTIGMTVAESSPGSIVDSKKTITTARHAAPATVKSLKADILTIYNRGDMRRWYWTCVGCGEGFEPSFERLSWEDSADFMECAETATLNCPHCGQVHTHEQTKYSPSKFELNQAGVWVAEGQYLKDGVLQGKRIRSDIASFWLMGPAAGMTDWKTLVFRYLQAKDLYERTGDENTLKNTVNVDQGLPYTPQRDRVGLLPEVLKASAHPYKIKTVPQGVRFLIATVDVQARSFEVQVHGVGENFDIWIIDRYAITRSKRKDDDGKEAWIEPGAYPEDWHILVDEVATKTYELNDGSGRRMQIKACSVDSGGEAGVANNAYSFWRWLRDKCEVTGLHRRFHLIKGTGNKSNPRIKLTYPDSTRKDRKAAANGDVPVWQINSNTVKDQAQNMLSREHEGGGKVTFTADLPDKFYEELTAEERTPKGWLNQRNARNESWDLLVYCIAISLTPGIQVEHIRWDNPPKWAAPWDVNDLIIAPETGPKYMGERAATGKLSIAELAQKLA